MGNGRSRTNTGRSCIAALAAAKAVVRYLDVPVPGAWRDVMTETGAFPDEPSPASTLYHLVSAWRQLCES